MSADARLRWTPAVARAVRERAAWLPTLARLLDAVTFPFSVLAHVELLRLRHFADLDDRDPSVQAWCDQAILHGKLVTQCAAAAQELRRGRTDPQAKRPPARETRELANGLWRAEHEARSPSTSPPHAGGSAGSSPAPRSAPPWAVALLASMENLTEQMQGLDDRLQRLERMMQQHGSDTPRLTLEIEPISATAQS